MTDEDQLTLRPKLDEVDLESLRPDPDQPRKEFSEDAIDEMTATIRQVGNVNPIELKDDTNEIGTGELRWRGLLRAGVKRTVVKRVYGLTPAQWFLRQVSENFQHHELNDKEAGDALLRLRELRQRDELPAPPTLEVSVSPRNKNPRGGRPPGHEPGSVRELALIVGKSYAWVSRRISDTYVDPEDIPEELRPAVEGGSLAKDAVAYMRRRCPEPYREDLTRRLAAEATRGFVATQGVSAILDGLRAVEQTGAGVAKAQELIDLVQANERGDFIEAQVKVITPQSPEELSAVAARDEAVFDRALDAASRLLIATDRTAQYGRRSKTRARVTRLAEAAEIWLKSIDVLSASAPAPAPTPVSASGDFDVTDKLSKTARQVLEIVLFHHYVVGQPTREYVLDMFLPETVTGEQRREALNELVARDMLREHAADDDPKLKTHGRLWLASQKRRYVFADGACVAVPSLGQELARKQR